MALPDWKQLRQQLQERQTGIIQPDDDKSWLDGWDSSAENAQEDYFARFLAHNDLDPKNAEQRRIERLSYPDPNVTNPSNYLTESDIVSTGYGQSSGDTNLSFNDWIKNPVDFRANAQSSSAKFWNGAAKMVPYAFTTFLDNTAGLLAGILNVGYDAANGDSFHPMDSFISNPFAEAMQSIRDWSEKTFPNWRTTKELEEQDQWWKHLNANFWGDTFLKNFGFTIGAAMSGNLYAKGFRRLQGRLVNNAYKAAVAASVDGDAAAEAAFQKVLQGGPMQSPKKIYDELASTARSYRKLSAQSALVGGIGGAVGESRVEAMTAAKEFRDKNLEIAKQNYAKKRQVILAQFYTNPNNFIPQDVYDGYGNVVDRTPVLTADATTAMENELANLQKEFEGEINAINNEADDLATGVFWLNMPLLTATNVVMFGRMFSGGFRTQAKAKVGGTFGNYRGIGSDGNAVLSGIKNAATEGFEELSQKIFSEGWKDIAETDMAAFHNGKYDKDSIRDLSSWMMSMASSASDVLKDPTSWEEFAVGFLTGAIGMPAKGGWSGGIVGGIQEGLQQKKESEAMAQELNKRINDPQFREMWEGIVRHNKYEKAKDDALSKNKSFAWHGANDAQILSDVMMFADVGRLNELEDFVDSFANMDIDQVKKLRSTFIDENDKDFQNKSDQEMLTWLKERAYAVKKAIEQYRSFHDSIDYLSFGTTDKEAINEMIYTQAQLKNFEDRYNTILNGVIERVKPTLVKISKQVKADNSPTDNAKKAQEILGTEGDLTTLFGGSALDIKARAQDANPSDSAIAAYLLDNKTQEKVLNQLEQWGLFAEKSGITKQEISDLQQLIRSRQNFYAKLIDPRFRQKFEESAITQEKVKEEVQKQEVKQESNGLDSLDAVKREYFGKKSAREKIDFLRRIGQIENENQNVKQFMDLTRYWGKFNAFLEKNPLNLDPMMFAGGQQYGVMQDVLRRAKSIDDMRTLPDSVFMPYDEYAIMYGDATNGAPSRNSLETIKQQIREAMKKFTQGESASANKEMISTKPVETSSKDEVSSPTGRDASQPASVEPAPESKSEPVNAQSEETEKEEVQEYAAPEQVSDSEKEESETNSDDLMPENPISKATEEELLDDVVESTIQEPEPEAVEEKVSLPGKQSQWAYYRTSIPEIDIDEARKARTAIENPGGEISLKDANLSDLPNLRPSYTEMWNALNERNAFENISRNVEKNDEIEFVIDPTFPLYNGSPQILMTVVKDGQRKVLNILSGQTSKYLGLKELRETINQEYNKFKESNPNDLFVFGKKSRVWAKRDGLVNYNYEADYKSDKPIKDIQGYNENATIMFIDRHGKARAVRGSKNHIANIAGNYNNEKANIGEGDSVDRRGRLYYLVKSGGRLWVPIRLNVEHFRQETKNLEAPTFSEIRRILGKMSIIVADANDANYKEQDDALKKELASLAKLLDIRRDFFSIKKFDNVGVVLEYSSPDISNNVLRRPEQITSDWLIDLLADRDRSVQIHLDQSGNIGNLKTLIDEGLITSNAEKLWQKGADFYIEAWDAEKSDFFPSPSQMELEKEAARENPTESMQPISHKERDESNAQIDISDDYVFEDQDEFGDFMDDVETRDDGDVPVGLTNKDVEKIERGSFDEDPVVNLIQKELSEMPDNVREVLSKDFSEKAWHEAPDHIREKALRCLGV